MLKKVLMGLTDVVFPPCCISCSDIMDRCEDSSSCFCPRCESQIARICSPVCPCCGMPMSGGSGSDHLCGECLRERPPFSRARSLGRYEKALLAAIHKFKYGGNVAIGEILGNWMAVYAYPDFELRDYSLILPVPLHLKRLREREFNQSAILAKAIARRFPMPLELMTLKRSVHTEPQVTLGKEDREANVRGAFEIRVPERLRGERVVLVDDVYTTGSTVKECARILMESHAADVAVLTLARAV